MTCSSHDSRDMSSPADFQKLERSQKICSKTPVKASCILMQILMIFASILALKTLPKNRFPSTFFRRFPQDMSRCPQDVPRRLQDTSKTPLRPPKTSPRRLWTAQRRLQAASSCRETPQEYYKIERFEKSLNFHCFSFDFSSFFMLPGFP